MSATGADLARLLRAEVATMFPTPPGAGTSTFREGYWGGYADALKDVLRTIDARIALEDPAARDTSKV